MGEPPPPSSNASPTPFAKRGLSLWVFRLCLRPWVWALPHEDSLALRVPTLARCPCQCPWPVSMCPSTQWLLPLWRHLRSPP